MSSDDELVARLLAHDQLAAIGGLGIEAAERIEAQSSRILALEYRVGELSASDNVHAVRCIASAILAKRQAFREAAEWCENRKKEYSWPIPVAESALNNARDHFRALAEQAEKPSFADLPTPRLRETGASEGGESQ